MSTLIIIVHIVVCISLILIVLLQTGKGADMGAAFGGGGSHTLFGSTGASSFLSKMTTGAAVVFMLTSLTLAYFSGQRPVSSIIPDSVPAPMTQSGEEAVPGGAAPVGEMPEGAPSEAMAPADVPAGLPPSEPEGATVSETVPGKSAPLPATDGGGTAADDGNKG